MNPAHAEVSLRACHRCEYCHAPQVIFNSPFEVEHITPSSKSGGDDLGNLALACRHCNVHKSDHVTGEDGVTPLFHPRRDRWEEHFEVDRETATIVPRTEIGKATIVRLKMNQELQRQARGLWMQLRNFP